MADFDADADFKVFAGRDVVAQQHLVFLCGMNGLRAVTLFKRCGHESQLQGEFMDMLECGFYGRDYPVQPLDDEDENEDDENG